jgi:8-oxo-dGTP diphosphatase
MGGTGLRPKSVAPREAAAPGHHVLYHGAHHDDVGSILSSGLRGAPGQPIVTDSREGAELYAHKRDWTAPKVLEIHVPDDQAGRHLDEPEQGTAIEGNVRALRETLPPEFVRAVHEAGSGRNAAWSPSSGIFAPTTGLDPQLFEGGSLRPMVRAEIMERLDRCIRVDVQLAGTDWQQWLRVWVAGGSASEWAGSRPNDVAQDLDVLVGLDLAKAQGNSSFEGMDARQAATALNAAFRGAFNDPQWQPASGGTWSLTAYCNPLVGSDIAAIRPYAAWDLTGSRWAVKPPHLPDHTLADFDPAVVAHARAVLAEARAILRMPEPLRTREARALWAHVHEHRCEAFSAEGTGWDDPGNIDDKFLQYAHGRVMERIRDLAYAPRGVLSRITDLAINTAFIDKVSSMGNTAAAREDAREDESTELPLRHGLWYRAHPEGAFPIDPGRAQSRIIDGRGRSIGQRGLSAMAHPVHLMGYLGHAEWYDLDDENRPAWNPATGSRKIIAFHGTEVGRGADDEPLVMPKPDHSCCGRTVHATWSLPRFDQLTDEHYPNPTGAITWSPLTHDRTLERASGERGEHRRREADRQPGGHLGVREAAWEDEGEDTDRYVTCGRGCTHWGSAGAAGLLVRHRGDDGQHRYLLQHRSPYVQHGGTWSTPGGALHHGEEPEQGARREAEEEFGSLPHDLTHHHTFSDDHGGGWAYHTVVLDSPRRFSPHGGGDDDWETQGHGWFTPEEMKGLQLHPGFAASWAKVRKSGAAQVPDRKVREYEGTVGDPSHITRSEEGLIPTSAVAGMPGARGERPGEHRNRQGEAWEEFKRDIAANGIRNPIFITVDHGEEPKISEGNHRRDAAVELGIPHIPAEIRYFGHAERQGLVGERGGMRREAAYEPDQRIVRNVNELGWGDDEWAAARREPWHAASKLAQQQVRFDHPNLGMRFPDQHSGGDEMVGRILGHAGYQGDASGAFVARHPNPEARTSNPSWLRGAPGVALHPERWDYGTVAHECAHHAVMYDHAAAPNEYQPDEQIHGPEWAGHYASALNRISKGAGDDFLGHHRFYRDMIGEGLQYKRPGDLDAADRRWSEAGAPQNEAQWRRQGSAEPAWHSLAGDEPNHAVFSAVQDEARRAHPGLSAPVADPTGTLRKMLGRASFILPKDEIDAAQAPAGQHDTLGLAHHAAHVITDSRQAQEDAVPRMPGDKRPLSGEMDPDDRRHGHGFAWHYALALDGAGHDQAADDLRGGYAGAQVRVADHRHALGLARDFPGSDLSPHMPPDLGHLPEMPESQRKAMAPGAHRNALLDVARNPEPGTRIWRGERRETAEETSDAGSVGLHWSVHPANTITHPYNDDKGSRPVLWQARLEHPAEQAIPRSHPMWQGKHMSMDSEAEVRLHPGSSVHVEGAWVGQPGSSNPSPVYPLNPGRNGPGWEWHPVDRHVPVSHRPGWGHSIDYSDVGIPKEAAAASDGPWYHGTNVDIGEDNPVKPGHRKNFGEGKSTHVYFTESEDGARKYANWVAGTYGGEPHVYEVKPESTTGWETVGGERPPGAPREYKTKAWLRTVREMPARSQPMEREAAKFAWYHGTASQYQPGDLVDPAYAGKVQRTARPGTTYFTHSLGQATDFADWAQKAGKTVDGGYPAAHVYEVEPTGDYEEDPDDPRSAWASKSPLRVVRHVMSKELGDHWPKTAVTGYENLTERSGMIYLDLPEGAVRHLPGGVDDHHITLVYLGKDVGDEAFEEALRRAKEAAGAHPPMEGSIGGLGSFPPSDSSEGKTPVFVPVDVPGVHALRRSLEDLSASEFKKFVPHVTRAYLEEGDAMPAPHPTVPVSFGRLHVKRGDDITSFPFGGQLSKAAAWDASGSEKHGVYLRFGHWPHDERSFSPAGGYKEEGVSAYDLDEHGNPSIDHGLDRGHVHDPDWCDEDCQDHLEDPDNDPREEMQGRVARAERNRYYGEDKPGETGHLVKGEMSGIGYDGEPLLKNVRRVGDWIDHRHQFIYSAAPHRLARDEASEDYEPPEEKPGVHRP